MATTRSKQGPPPALTLLVGSEDLLIRRAIASTLGRVRAVDPSAARHDVNAEEASAASVLLEAVSPSLFAEAAVVVVSGLGDASSAFVETLLRVSADLPESTYLVALHNGVRGRKYLDQIRAVIGPDAVLDCAPIKKGRATKEFLSAHASGQGRRITDEALDALTSAIGADLGLLLGGLDQLMADLADNPLTADSVATAFSGVAAISGFQLSDAVLERNPVLAMSRLRWGMETASLTGPGAVGAMASGIRSLVRVGSAPPGATEADIARSAGIPVFKVRQIKALVRRWNGVELAAAAVRLSAADAAMKGGLRKGENLDASQKARELEEVVLTTATGKSAARR